VLTVLDQESFNQLYPEFKDIPSGRFASACGIALALSSDWQGLDDAVVETANNLLVAHVLTILVDGASPVNMFETKESKTGLSTTVRNKQNSTFNFHVTDYGLLLNDILNMSYFGVM
jgi:hypothetical protein